MNVVMAAAPFLISINARIMKPASTMGVIAIATLSPVQNMPH